MARGDALSDCSLNVVTSRPVCSSRRTSNSSLRLTPSAEPATSNFSCGGWTAGRRRRLNGVCQQRRFECERADFRRGRAIRGRFAAEAAFGSLTGLQTCRLTGVDREPFGHRDARRGVCMGSIQPDFQPRREERAFAAGDRRHRDGFGFPSRIARDGLPSLSWRRVPARSRRSARPTAARLSNWSAATGTPPAARPWRSA